MQFTRVQQFKKSRLPVPGSYALVRIHMQDICVHVWRRVDSKRISDNWQVVEVTGTVPTLYISLLGFVYLYVLPICPTYALES